MKTGFEIHHASAGSGKTYMLALRYLALCLVNESGESIPFKRILAITFTNKAANELKDRILEFMAFLSGWSKGKEQDILCTQLSEMTGIEKSAIINSARRLYPLMLYNYSDLHVSTIDSFVLNIVRSFSRELGLSIDFDVKIERDDVVQELTDTMIDCFGNDAYLSKRLLAYGNNNLDESKSWDIRSGIRKLIEGLLDVEGMSALRTYEPLKTEPIRQFIQETEQNLKKARSVAIEAQSIGRELIKKTGLGLDKFNGGQRNTMFRIFYREFSSSSYRGLTEKQEADLQKEEFKFHSGATDKAEKAIIQSVREELRATTLQLNSRIRELGAIKTIQNRSIVLDVIHHLLTELPRIQKDQGFNLLSTNDNRIAKVVRDNPVPFIYERISQKYHHYLIDEFQDTNVRQWHNMIHLVVESLSNGRSNIVVGDAKQSIYRWRGGEVQQFIDLPSIYKKEEDSVLQDFEQTMKNSLSPVLPLETNYRSLSAIVNFNNALFAYLSRSFLDEEYSGVYERHEQKTAGSSRDGGYVEIQKIEEGSKDEPSFKDRSMPMVAEHIINCLDDGYSLRDICILVHANKDARMIATYLKEQKIPSISSDSFRLDSSLQVRCLIAMMSYVDDSDSKVNRLMLQDTLGRTIREKDNIAQNDRASEIEKLLAAASQFQNDEDDIFSLASSIIRLLGLDPDDPYMVETMHLIASRRNQDGDSLKSFLEMWTESGRKKSLKGDLGKEAVEIMTVHKSKGLEFPVIILPFIGDDKRKVSERWIEHEDERAPLLLMQPTERILSQHFEKEKRLLVLDAMNTLYVATTRPKERLYINVKHQKLGKNTEAHLRHLLCAWKWEELKEIEGGWSYGKREKKKLFKEESTSMSQRDSQSYPTSNWRDTIRISLGSNQSFSPKQEIGKLVHAILANEHVDQSNKHLEEAKAIVARVYEMSELKELENSGMIQLNERSLIGLSGKRHIPDRVYLDESNKKAVVVDFKTGMREESHKKQVQRYASLLQEMGISEVRAYLLYTQELEMVSVA